MIWDDSQPCATFNLKTVAILIAKPDCLGTASEQLEHRFRSANVAEAVAQRFSGEGPKLLIGDRFVDAQVQQLFSMKGNFQDAKEGSTKSIISAAALAPRGSTNATSP